MPERLTISIYQSFKKFYHTNLIDLRTLLTTVEIFRKLIPAKDHGTKNLTYYISGNLQLISEWVMFQDIVVAHSMHELPNSLCVSLCSFFRILIADRWLGTSNYASDIIYWNHRRMSGFIMVVDMSKFRKSNPAPSWKSRIKVDIELVGIGPSCRRRMRQRLQRL